MADVVLTADEHVPLACFQYQLPVWLAMFSVAPVVVMAVTVSSGPIGCTASEASDSAPVPPPKSPVEVALFTARTLNW